MWWQLFIVFVATAAASEDEDEIHSPDCMSLMYHECEPTDGKIPDFPGNGEELEVFCEFAMQYFDCADRVFSSCAEDDNFMIRFERETAASFRRICNEDQLLHAAVASILPCFKENMRRIGRCEESFTLDRESFVEALNELEITDIDESDSGLRCLDVLYMYGCIAATTGQFCGDVARDVVVNILQGYEVPLELCPAGVKDKVPDIAEVMQIEAEKVNSVEEKLKKKK